MGDMSGIEASNRPGIPLLVELLNSLQESPCSSTGALLERWRDRPDVEHLSKLARLECYIPDAQGAVRELRDALEHLHDEGALVRREQLLAKHSREGLNEAEKLELQALLRSNRPVAP
jgi:DNA primase